MGFNFNFLKKAAKDVGHATSTVARGDNKAGGGVFGFLDNQLLPSDAQLKEKKKEFTQGRDLAVSTARSIPRGGAELAATAGIIKSGAQPKPGLGELIYGKEPIQTSTQAAKDFGQSLPGHKTLPTPIAFPVGLGLSFPGVPKKNIAKDLIEATTGGKVKKLIPGIDDAKAQAIASQKDPHIIENVIHGENKVAPPPSPVPAPEVPQPNPRIKVLDEQIKTQEQLVKHAPNDTAKAKIQSNVSSLIKERGALNEQALGESPTLPRNPSPTAPTSISDIKPPGKGDIPPVKTDLPTPDPFEEISKAITGTPSSKGQAPIKGIAAARAEQNTLLSHERGQRFTAVNKLGETEFGDQGFYKRKGALKGEYTKIDNPYADRFTPEQSKDLFVGAQKKIYSLPDSVYEKNWEQHGLHKPLHASGAKFNTEIAVRKVLGLEPGLPTDSEIRLIGVVSPKLAQATKESRPAHRQMFDWAAKIAGSVRGAKSTLDLSMGGRQGIFVAARHPIAWAKANKESVKYAKSEKYYAEEMAKAHNDEWGQLIDKYDPKVLTGGGAHEEQYAGTDLLTGPKAKKLGYGHLVAGSERAYTGGLTTLRKSILEKNFKAYGATAAEAEKNLGPEGVAGLLEAARTLTGRGGKKGGFIDKHASTLNETLFSPRLWASRLQPFNPKFWKRIGPAGRKEAYQSLGAFAAVAGTVLGAAVAAGADVETDPRSSDFLKIKVGDTRYDILGGFQQNLVFGWRQLSGERKSSTTGKVTKFERSLTDIITQKSDEEAGVSTSPLKGSRLTGAADLVGNKLNPLLASGLKIYEGKDKSGNDVNPYTEIGQLFVPISLQGTYHGGQDEGVKGAAKSLPDYVGISSQTYGLKDINLSSDQKKYTGKLTGEQKVASERFYQTQKTGPDRDSYSAQIKKALKANDIPQAEKLAQTYNKEYSASFNKWLGEYKPYANDKKLVKDYNSNKITSASFDRWLSEIKRDKQGDL